MYTGNQGIWTALAFMLAVGLVVFVLAYLLP